MLILLFSFFLFPLCDVYRLLLQCKGGFMAGNRKVLIKKETRDIPVNVWHPNDSYKLTLQEIREQLTPAGIYRHKLATTGKAERVLRRLEWRWERRLQKWTKAATTVQAGYRGMIGRRYFKTIRIELEIKKAQREAKIAAIEAFKAGDREKTIEILSMVEQMTGELYIVKAKVLYTLGQFEDSIECALAALSTPSMEYDARFILANCYTRKNQMLSAFDQLNLLAIAGDRRTDSRRLLAYVATRLDPPNYDESISVLDTLIDDFPEDMNLVSISVNSFQLHIATPKSQCLLLHAKLSQGDNGLFEYIILSKRSGNGFTSQVSLLCSSILHD